MNSVLDCVFIETTTACTRRCRFCTHYYHDIIPHFMHEDLFLKIMDDLRSIDYSGRLSFYMNGEPLLDRRLEKWVGIAKSSCPKALNFINTNGDLLTEARALDLFDSGLDAMKVNSYTEKVAEKIEGLMRTLPDRFRSKIIHNAVSGFDGWSSRGGVVKTAAQSQPRYPGPICPRPFRQLYIKVTGEVALCCTDDQCQHVMGDVRLKTVEEIWHGESFESVRHGFIGESKLPALCYRCDLEPSYQEVCEIRALFS
ncbi:radical SAM/SPASM domain-containing protein [Allochromatium humboldtianum]|uniref:Radical SAM/SPASM domain-containing protein n=1 Tax=Allochromatium humboldtianum TaxID=504901 RepID=A0A850R9G9_9GAMM|nr:radical SAM/SPASM domain-containing protein [Allochromatium humboldtianum]NVZ07922.1 radical SAM/SPASM domain-containing protein [Allochromatium humboldtianum]